MRYTIGTYGPGTPTLSGKELRLKQNLVINT